MQGAGTAVLPRPREGGVCGRGVGGAWEGSAAASGLRVLACTRERKQERDPPSGKGLRREAIWRPLSREPPHGVKAGGWGREPIRPERASGCSCTGEKGSGVLKAGEGGLQASGVPS